MKLVLVVLVLAVSCGCADQHHVLIIPGTDCSIDEKACE